MPRWWCTKIRPGSSIRQTRSSPEPTSAKPRRVPEAFKQQALTAERDLLSLEKVLRTRSLSRGFQSVDHRHVVQVIDGDIYGLPTWLTTWRLRFGDWVPGSSGSESVFFVGDGSRTRRGRVAKSSTISPEKSLTFFAAPNTIAVITVIIGSVPGEPVELGVIRSAVAVP